MLKNLDIMDKLLPELSEPSRQLDVTVLHSLVLERISALIRKIWQIRLTLHTPNFSQRLLRALATASSNARLCLIRQSNANP